MPAPSPFVNGSGPSQQAPYPALYLYPLNDSFVPKHIALVHGQHVKIGRQTNAKTSPGERNGYFDSKVLSRQHAEVWEEGGKIYIKDVKSSNGTFINSERLSAEGVESEPYEIKSDDIVEFGIDIVGEDNKTIMHRKVAARALCVLSEADYAAATRGEQSHHHQQAYAGPAAAASSSASSSNGFNFNQRLGGMGGGMRQPGKSGLTFDHILSRLQGELQKSRETGAELAGLNGAMGEIRDTLGGALPPNGPPYPPNLPAVQQRRSSSSADEQQQQQPALATLQAQLAETQSALAGHVEKMRGLEGLLAEHEAIKHEVSGLKAVVEARREMEEKEKLAREYDGESDDDGDDARSVGTVVPHELERVEEEDEDEQAQERATRQEQEDEEDRRMTRVALGRPRTPEPSGMGMHTPEEEDNRPPSPSVVDELTQRLTTLASQLESALELSSTLQAQHAAAQTTISALESKVNALETLVHAPPPPPVEPEKTERESLAEMLAEWKTSVEGQWGVVREEWSAERERLARAREEWAGKVETLESSFTARVDALQQQAALRRSFGAPSGDAGAHHVSGLVTPPSPRSLSADSDKPRHRRRRSRGRSHSSRSQSPGGTDTTAVEDIGADADGIVSTVAAKLGAIAVKEEETSLRLDDDLDERKPDDLKLPIKPADATDIVQMRHMSTAVGVLVLSVAAAAVIWRVRPE